MKKGDFISSVKKLVLRFDGNKKHAILFKRTYDPKNTWINYFLENQIVGETLLKGEQRWPPQ